LKNSEETGLTLSEFGGFLLAIIDGKHSRLAMEGVDGRGVRGVLKKR
jgi:hypothetical protein